MEGKECLLMIDDITVDPDVQDRADLSEETIKEYAQLELDDFPPVRVWHLDGVYLLAAGHHTLAAHQEASKTHIRAIVFQGGKEDAILDAVRSNTKHGLRRTGRDRRRAATQLVKTFPEWSDRVIADNALVDDHLVAALRRELAPPPERKCGNSAPAHSGTPAPRRTDATGRKQPATKEDADNQRLWIRELVKKEPNRTGRDIADEVGCSSRTVDIIKKAMKAEAAGEIKPPPERQPGDDTEEIKRQRAEDRAKPKNGRLLNYDWKPFNASYGALVREIDALGNLHNAKETPQAEGLRRKLTEFLGEFQAWHKTLTKKRSA